METHTQNLEWLVRDTNGVIGDMDTNWRHPQNLEWLVCDTNRRTIHTYIHGSRTILTVYVRLLRLVPMIFTALGF